MYNQNFQVNAGIRKPGLPGAKPKPGRGVKRPDITPIQNGKKPVKPKPKPGRVTHQGPGTGLAARAGAKTMPKKQMGR